MSTLSSKRKSLKEKFQGFFTMKKEDSAANVDISTPTSFSHNVHVSVSKEGDMQNFDKMLTHIEDSSKFNTATWEKLAKLKSKRDETLEMNTSATLGGSMAVATSGESNNNGNNTKISKKREGGDDNGGGGGGGAVVIDKEGKKLNNGNQNNNMNSGVNEKANSNAAAAAAASVKDVNMKVANLQNEGVVNNGNNNVGIIAQEGQQQQQEEQELVICEYGSEVEEKESQEMYQSGPLLKSAPISFDIGKQKGFLLGISNLPEGTKTEDIEFEISYYSSTKCFQLELTIGKVPYYANHILLPIENLVGWRKSGIKRLVCKNTEGKPYLILDCPVTCMFLRDQFSSSQRR